MLFKYKARDKNGEVIEDVIQADSEKEAVALLSGDDYQVLTIKSFETKSSVFSKGISISEKAAFCRFMATMLRAGLPLPEAVDIIRQESQNKRLTQILLDISFHIRRGESLSSILAKYSEDFDVVFLTMVKAGEESGSLGKTFDYLARQMLAAYELSQKIKSSLMYPIIIVVAMIANAIVMLGFVLPKMSEVFLSLNVEIPVATMFLLRTGKTIGENLGLTMGILFALIFLGVVILYIRKTREMILNLLVKLPVISTVMDQLDTARFARTLSTLLKSAVPIMVALDVSSDVLKQPRLRKSAKEFSKGVAEGKTLADILKKGDASFPLTLIQTIRAGEKTGSLELVLEELASFYEMEVDYSLKRATSLIEPLLMLVIGIVVGAMVVLMITPIYSIVGGLEGGAF